MGTTTSCSRFFFFFFYFFQCLPAGFCCALTAKRVCERERKQEHHELIMGIHTHVTAAFSLPDVVVYGVAWNYCKFSSTEKKQPNLRQSK